MKRIICLFFAFTSFFLIGLEVDIVSSFNIDELPARLLNIKREFKVNKTVPVDYLTRSANDPSLKKILVFDPTFGGGATIFPSLPKEKLVLFVWEPDILSLDIYDAYSRVYTWDDELIDNVKFFRFNYPYLMPYRNNVHSFQKRQLCTIVVNKWTEQRLEVVRFFEAHHPEGLTCYGRCPPGLRNVSMHKGHIPGQHSGDQKISTLQKYRFCICFENTTGTFGYITEKIFSCFAAGCIPIYWGPNNIENYIPKSCFIDYRDFETNERLYQYIYTMSEETHKEYVVEIKKYLSSEQAQQFSPKFFDDLVYEAIIQ